MDGLECSEVEFHTLETGGRIDAELYQKKYTVLNHFSKMCMCTTLGNECEVISKGIFNISASSYTDKGVPFVRISNIDGMFISQDEIVCIPEEENTKHKKTQLTRGDIILSKTGSPAAAYVDMLKCNVSQDTIAIKLNHNAKILPEYTVSYLNSVYGIAQMKKRFTGNIQMHLNLKDCKNKVIIPVLSMPFQQRIKSFFEKALLNHRASEESFAACEDMLNSSIGFSKNDVIGNNNTKKFLSESFNTTGRLDAEFYASKYDRFYSLLQSHCDDIKTIKDLSLLNSRGCQPYYDPNGIVSVINSRHILENTLDYEKFEKTSIKEWNNHPLARIEYNDILIYTTGANIGRTAIYLQGAKAMASNHVNILRVNYKYPIYIAVVLNSFIGRMQTERTSGGSAQQELYPAQISEFWIPFVDEKVQIEISERYKNALNQQKISSKSLKIAIRAIEIAIEQDETAAIDYINENKN